MSAYYAVPVPLSQLSDACRPVCPVPLGQQPSSPADDAAADGCRVAVTAGGGVGFAVRAPLHEWRGSCTLSSVAAPAGAAAAAAAVWGWEMVSAGRLVCAASTEDGYQLWVVEVAVPETARRGCRHGESQVRTVFTWAWNGEFEKLTGGWRYL